MNDYISNIISVQITKMSTNLDYKEDELIIEPSAGNGSFSSKIMESHISFQAFDIDPKSKEIKKTLETYHLCLLISCKYFLIILN